MMKLLTKRDAAWTNFNTSKNTYFTAWRSRRKKFVPCTFLSDRVWSLVIMFYIYKLGLPRLRLFDWSSKLLSLTVFLNLKNCKSVSFRSVQIELKVANYLLRYWRHRWSFDLQHSQQNWFLAESHQNILGAVSKPKLKEGKIFGVASGVSWNQAKIC